MAEAMNLSCREFVDILASKAPAPGGGGAAAYVGALGMALGNMVGSLTVGKPKYADVEDEVIALKRQADALQDKLLFLVALDAKAFEPLARAYGLPSSSQEEKVHKAQVMEECLRDACEVPLRIMRACGEAIDLHEQFVAVGTSLAISDVGCGAIICKAALKAASLNVFVNTKSMQDREYAGLCEAEARSLLKEYGPKADAIFSSVEQELR